MKAMPFLSQLLKSRGFLCRRYLVSKDRRIAKCLRVFSSPCISFSFLSLRSLFLGQRIFPRSARGSAKQFADLKKRSSRRSPVHQLHVKLLERKTTKKND